MLPLHGYSEAALVDGDKVFWTPGGKVNNVVALNRFTGDIVWSNPGFGEAQGYNQPRLIRLPGLNILVTFSSWHLMGFDTSTGKMLWSHEQDNLPVDKRKPGYGDTHCNTVIYENGYIWYVAGDGNCAVKLALAADGKSIKEIWRNTGFDGYMGGTVKLGDYIYGGGTAKPELRAINAITGQLTDSLKLGAGAIIAADDMIYYYSQKGDLTLLSYNNGKMQKISSFRVTKGTKEHFSHPVINKGILYQRHGQALVAYDIRRK
jgi:outer membrane protein assembly factor BamB